MACYPRHLQPPSPDGWRGKFAFELHDGFVIQPRPPQNEDIDLFLLKVVVRAQNFHRISNFNFLIQTGALYWRKSSSAMASNLPLRLLNLVDGQLQVIDPQAHGVREFDIITYTWGETIPKYRCEIPGTNWTVAIDPRKLKDIKRLMEVAKIQYLWVDCVCLNQDDEQEMAVEVLKMYQYVSNWEMRFVVVASDYLLRCMLSTSETNAN